MTALASEIGAPPVEIDLTILAEEGATTTHVSLDPSLGNSADRPIELDLELEGMEIDMDVSLFGEEPANDISTTNPFNNPPTAVGENVSSPPSLLEAFDGVNQAGVTTLPFDMAMDEAGNIDFSKFESMMNTSDMGIIDMNTLDLLNMGSETGTQPEGQNGAGHT
jgi:hypothetical protein